MLKLHFDRQMASRSVPRFYLRHDECNFATTVDISGGRNGLRKTVPLQYSSDLFKKTTKNNEKKKWLRGERARERWIILKWVLFSLFVNDR